jgi:hypothetical protein
MPAPHLRRTAALCDHFAPTGHRTPRRSAAQPHTRTSTPTGAPLKAIVANDAGAQLRFADVEIQKLSSSWPKPAKAEEWCASEDELLTSTTLPCSPLF